MRVPTDLARRRRRPGRRRFGLVVIVAAVLFVIVSLRGVAGFYTDLLWFDQLNLVQVWRGILGAKVLLALIFTGLFFVVLLSNLAIADRLAPRFRPSGPEEEVIERYRELVGTRTGAVRVVIAAVFALIAGLGTSAQWNDWILYTHRTPFGSSDPLFHKDLSFYIFQLPFLTFLVDWAFASMVIVFIVTAVAHYVNGGIRVQVPAVQRVTPQVKAHLSVLLGVLALLKAAQYWLQRYKLTYSTRGFVDGASYTDVKAQLPALQLLVFISVLAFILFLVNIRLRGWTLPAIAVGLWAFTSLVVGAAYPAFIHKFRVQPTESAKERPYIQRNIDATRQALGLNDVKVNNFRYDEKLTGADLAQNSATIRNVRLWDPGVLARTFGQQQEIRKFYRFNEVDIDRYMVDGRLTQVMLSARELDSAEVPAKTWENLHLNFTHGYGAVMSPANAVTRDGLPDYLIKDLPPTGQPRISQPAIYYGEDLDGYAIVRTDRQEIDYQTEQGTVRTTYQGDGGVEMSSWIRRVAFALRFGDVNPLISGFINSKSRAIYVRDISERVRRVAPFLRFDADPYPVVLDGRIFWVQDAYTVTTRYPYAQRAAVDRLPPGSGLKTRFNYVRNSVKVLTNAYDGSMTFYVVDQQDPIIRSYMKAFPRLFEAAPVPQDLRSHLRYPEDMFRVQTTAFGDYHITRAADFYDKNDAWEVARDPGSGEIASGTATTNPPGSPTALGPPPTERKMDPYYLLMRLPNEQSESFLILQPFTPASKDLLSAFLVAKSDPNDYGKLEAFVMPRNQSVNGPRQVDAKINQEPTISREISLLNTSGSKVLSGNLVLIPVNQSLLYVRPLYVQAQGTPLPELKLVVVAHGNRVVATSTLRDSLASIFGTVPETQEQQSPRGPGPVAGPAPPGSPTPPGGSNSEVQNLINQASSAFQAADDALKAGNLAEFQNQVNRARQLTEQARARASSGAPGSAVSPSPSTTTTVPASA